MEKKLSKEIQDFIDSINEAHAKIPKGWVDIESHLPMMLAQDVFNGGTLYKVKDKEGNEFHSSVSDHNVWYYEAKELGITHWWNN